MRDWRWQVMAGGALFVLLVASGGFGAFAGSVLGGLVGTRALFIGAVAGGIVGSAVAPVLAARWRWLERREVAGTGIGAVAGFLAAALVAVNTMSSPAGPVVSTLLIGVGGLAGRRLGGGVVV
jgi:hypothetical protein